MRTYISRIYFSFSIFTIILILSGCEDFFSDSGNNLPPDNEYKVTIQQGVWGNVWFWEGNFMPSTDNSSDGKITAVVRNIYVYEATRYDSVLVDSTKAIFIQEIYSNFIEQITSDKDGFFQIALPPGKYSFFVKEDSLYFANESDGDGYLMSAEVIPNTVVKRQIDINYEAVY